MTLKTANLLKKYIIETIINLTITYPGFDFSFSISSFGAETKYTLGNLISILQFAKVAPFIDLLKLTSPYTSATAERICENNGIASDLIFLFKVNMRLRSLQILALAYGVGMIFFSFCVMIFEENQ